MNAPVRVGVIGVGYWGPNLVRNFAQLPNTTAKWAADLNPDRLAHMATVYPTLQTTQDYHEILADPEVDAVVVATPADSHCKLTCEALEAGKHVFVEKPMASNVEQCRRMVEAAQSRERILMVGHTFLYNSALHRIKKLIDEGDLGQIFYVYINRVNLGLFREDCNVVWDLAPHDVAILGWLLGGPAKRVAAIGHSYVQPGIEDVAFVNLEYEDNVMAHLHVSWLDPNKVRKLTVVGSRKMLVYDDVSNTEKLRVYDKGVSVLPHYDTFGEFQLSYRYGDIVLPRIEDTEPLKNEAEHFVHCIRTGARPLSDGTNGLEVVEVLEAACQSMLEGGRSMNLNGVRSRS